MSSGNIIGRAVVICVMSSQSVSFLYRYDELCGLACLRTICFVGVDLLCSPNCRADVTGRVIVTFFIRAIMAK